MEIPKVKYVKFNSKRNFGIELEMNNAVQARQLVKVVAATDPNHPVIMSDHYQQDYGNGYWHVKFDRSCGDVEGQGGWEVASYKASGYKDVDNMGEVTDALKVAGVVTNNNCGFHIHAEIADFTAAHAASLVAYWLKIEPVVCEMLPKHRRGNKYCRLLTKQFAGEIAKSHGAREFWELVRPRAYDHQNRRVSLNMCNYAHNIPNRRTAELRLPECSMSGKDVKNWIRFYLMFVESAKQAQFPGNATPVGLVDAMRIVGFHGASPFLILSRGLREAKIWMCRRILTYSTKESLRNEATTFLNTLEVKANKKPEQKKQKVAGTPDKQKSHLQGDIGYWAWPDWYSEDF